MPGDVLLEVGRQPVDDGPGLRALVGDRRTALVTIWRGGGRSYAAVVDGP
jgi:hypothetical protein